MLLLYLAAVTAGLSVGLGLAPMLAIVAGGAAVVLLADVA